MPPEREKTILGRFRALPPRSRIMLGIVGMGFSTAGLFLSESLEKRQNHESDAHRGQLKK